MKVALIRNVNESRSLSMPFYADCLRDVLATYCNTMDVHLESDIPYQLAGMVNFRVQDYVGRFWSFPRQLRSLKADIFHIVDHANAHLVCELEPSRTVVTCHDLMLLKLDAGEIQWNGSRPWVASKTFRWSIKHLPHARAVLCDSESTKQDVVRLIGCAPERLYVVYLGLHEEFRRIVRYEYLEEARKRFGFTWPITIIHVGKNSFYKNLERIIESLALLPVGLQDCVHLVKVGLDFTLEQRDLIRRLGLNERMHFVGQLGMQDLVFLYNVADMLLFPSLYEGFGWPPLEAMACGTPVVCSDRGSLKEVVGDAAFIVDPEDPQSIANGVEQVLIDEQLCETLISRGLERAKLFSWTNTAKKVLKVYHEVAGTHSYPQN